MKITPVADFKQGRATLKKGKTYNVPDAMGEFFKQVGWANASTGKAETGKLDFSTDAPTGGKRG